MENVDSNNGGVSSQMLKYAKGISIESFVDVEGIIQFPTKPITGASKTASMLHFSLEDASRSEQAGEQFVRVNQDTRLNHRVMDLRTPAYQAIITLLFSQFLNNEKFRQTFTPKMIAGSSEGGASVFELNYKNQSACIVQSPQLRKQMLIVVMLNVHIWLLLFLELKIPIRTGICVNTQIMDFVDMLFVNMFDKLNETYQKELEAIRKQFPFKPLKVLKSVLFQIFTLLEGYLGRCKRDWAIWKEMDMNYEPTPTSLRNSTQKDNDGVKSIRDASHTKIRRHHSFSRRHQSIRTSPIYYLDYSIS
ncbi:aspartate--tRNA ligase 2, cytoplasmic [Tanacetum coccineum]